MMLRTILLKNVGTRTGELPYEQTFAGAEGGT